MPSFAATTDAASPEPAALGRLGQRWQALPLARAEELTPLLLHLAQRMADAVADLRGEQSVLVPRLGPAVVLDQLAVVTYDARAAGLDVARWEPDFEHCLSLTYTDGSLARPLA